MYIAIFEELLTCYKTQQEALVARDTVLFEKTIVDLARIQKRVHAVANDSNMDKSNIDQQTRQKLEHIREQIRLQRNRNDVLFKNIEQFVDFYQQEIQYLQETENPYRYQTYFK